MAYQLPRLRWYQFQRTVKVKDQWQDEIYYKALKTQFDWQSCDVEGKRKDTFYIETCYKWNWFFRDLVRDYRRWTQMRILKRMNKINEVF